MSEPDFVPVNLIFFLVLVIISSELFLLGPYDRPNHTLCPATNPLLDIIRYSSMLIIKPNNIIFTQIIA